MQAPNCWMKRTRGAIVNAAASMRRTVLTRISASAADRAAFAEELAGFMTQLVAKYHDEQSEGGRPHRVVVALHPSVNAAVKEDES